MTLPRSQKRDSKAWLTTPFHNATGFMAQDTGTETTSFSNETITAVLEARLNEAAHFALGELPVAEAVKASMVFGVHPRFEWRSGMTPVSDFPTADQARVSLDAISTIMR